MLGRLALQQLKWKYLSYFSTINPAPIIILGNQKSGTSAIAWLVSQSMQKSLTLDVTRAIENPLWQREIIDSTLDLRKWLNKYSYEFSRDVIKEPSLTLFAKQLAEHFPNAKFVFIVRDPRDNIRSILNRINVRGDLVGWPDLSHLGSAEDAWNMTLRTDWLGDSSSTGCIESLAFRWNYCCEQYLSVKNEATLIRYEDFRDNKLGIIDTLVKELDEVVVQDISSKVDTQLQSKGNNNQSWQAFYGDKNLEIINRMTKSFRVLFDYE